MADTLCPRCDSPKHPHTRVCLLCDLIDHVDPSHCGDGDCSAGQFRVMSRHWFLKAPADWSIN